jgi:internalin A
MSEQTKTPEEIAEERIQEAFASQRKALSLARLGLRTLPQSIGQLGKLVVLHLDNNQLSGLPESIGQFDKLQKLDLDHNGLTALPESIGQLHQIWKLRLSGNQLRALPESIGELSQLQALYLDNNQLRTLPESIGQLAKLKALYLNDNQLRALPESIGQLHQLWELYLNNNRLCALPSSIGQLGQLQELRLFNNQLSALPESIGQLGQLGQLHFDNNQLSALPESIGQLRWLRELSLNNNQLSALPESIGQLRWLRELSLNNNQLSALQEALLKLDNLEGLFLHGNEALGLPPEILGPTWADVTNKQAKAARPRDILDYYFATCKAAHPLNEMKLLLVGRGGAGKTSIVRRLRENKFVKGSRETQGITIKPWQVEADGRKATVHTWDFAGQVMTHATHQLFFSERSVYVLVLTGRENAEQTDAEYWLRLIRAFATEEDRSLVHFTASGKPELDARLWKHFAPFCQTTAPVIVALNKCKAHPCRLDREKLREKYPFIGAFMETDCARGTGIRELKQRVLAAVGRMLKTQRNFPAAWFGIKEAIEKDVRDYLSYEEFCALCAKHGETDPAQQRLLARSLHQLGLALNYADDERLCDTTVLDPHWVTQGIYTLLRKAKGRRHEEEMSLADVTRVLPKVEPRMRRFLVELMRRYELAFPMGDDYERWLVPQRLPEGQPRLDDKWFARDVTRVRFRYMALPEGLLPRFITRTYPLSEELPRWVNGVVLADAGAEVLVRADRDDREVSVAAIGPEPARSELAAFACGELRSIHAKIPGLDPVEEIEPQNAPGDYFPVATLRADEKARRETTVPTRSGSVEVSNTEELNRISTPKARDESRPRPKLFISYSRRDARQHDALLVRVKKLRDRGLVDSWSDRCLDPGELWDERIKREIAEAHVVLFLVSAHFEATDYIQNVEIVAACKRANAGECHVVPVILEKCDWENSPLKDFNALPAKAKPVRDWKPQSDAWYQVQQKLVTLLEKVAATLPRKAGDRIDPLARAS